MMPVIKQSSEDNGGSENKPPITSSSIVRSQSEQHLSKPNSSTNGLLSPNGFPPAKPKRTASYDDRLVVIEEVAPLQTKIRNEENVEETGSSWRISLKHFTSKRRGSNEEDKKLSRSVKRYYKRQDDLIAAFEGVELAGPDAESADIAENSRTRRLAHIMAKVSFFVNLLLLIGKLVVAILSGSLAVITSVLDSAVDLASGILMWWSSRAMKKRDPYRYPQGRSRLEPVAIIVLSVIMSLAMIQMIRESVEKIILYANYDREQPEYHNKSAVFCLTIDEMASYVHPGGDQRPVFEIDSIVICVVTIVSKLVLFLICRRIKSSGTQALAQDHRNDVISNFGAIACGLIGYKVWKYADPVGAIIICIYIIVSWFFMGRDFLSKLTWIAVNHHEKVTHVDTVRAFHFGNDFLVEVDIVLPADMSLMEAHDIGESLQRRLENLNEVERAFVHLDYEVAHHPLTEHKVV